MDIESTQLKKLDGIYDIQPPLIPEPGILENSIILFSIIVTLSVVLYLFWSTYYSNKGLNKRKIKKLQKAYRDTSISTHAAIYQLCYFLREGLQTSHVGIDTELPPKLLQKKNQWLSFTNTLSDLRYKNLHNSKVNLDKAFSESLYWLRIW